MNYATNEFSPIPAMLPPAHRHLQFPFGGEILPLGTRLSLDGRTYRVSSADYASHWYTLELVI